MTDYFETCSKKSLSPREQFGDHKRRAKRRGISFLLTFEEWQDIWRSSGHWDERGGLPHQYVMARFGDKGAYEVGNVRICTGAENRAEQIVTPELRTKIGAAVRASSPQGRGMARRSLDLIEAMHAAAEAAQPITGRGIGYKLFTRGLIASMAKSEMQRIYRLLKEARERGIIPWGWIVDETREIERVST